MDDFSAMREVKSVVGIVVGLALFLEPLGRGIDVHTPMFLDFMCIKYIARTGRNQVAKTLSLF